MVNGVAHESKVGYTSLTKTIRKQIEKDIELLQTKQIDGTAWHFFKSPITGKQGPSKALQKALSDAGIDIVLH